ncbi:MAG: hypothetical protein KatS3mg068_1064 [Candidatus Sericytochromatia bacterium]|nr:MAG: hypothetical protein KatS3mg068_1064 [Candidatus Sericytochromatia bacterium]
MISTLKDIISPVTIEDFFKNFYSRKHLYIKKEPSKKFSDIFNWSKLNNILENNFLYNLYVSLKDQKVLDIDIIGRDNLRKFLLNGFTLKLDIIEYLDKDLSQFVNSLKKEFLTDIKINLYSSYPDENKDAFAAHIDNYDIFIIHLEGNKKWYIADITTDYDYRKHIKYKLMEYEEKKWDKWISNKKLPSLDNFFEKNKSIFKEYILEPGDILYIPKGFVHKVIPIYKPSLHLTIGFTSISAMDFFIYLKNSLYQDLYSFKLITKKNYNFKHELNSTINYIKNKFTNINISSILEKLYQNWIINTPNCNLINLPYAQTVNENCNLHFQVNTNLFSISKQDFNFEIYLNYQSVILKNELIDMIYYIFEQKKFNIKELIEKFPKINKELILELINNFLKHSIINIYYESI